MSWLECAMHPAFYRDGRNSGGYGQFRIIHTAVLHSLVEAFGEFRALEEEKEEGNHLLSEGSAAGYRAIYQIISQRANYRE